MNDPRYIYKREWRDRNAERIRLKESSPQFRYEQHQRHAKARGIPFLLTFDEWWSLWDASGKWDERGRGGYCMCRTDDVGAYELGNVRIDSSGGNIREWKHKSRT